jgi:hypothetical protein
MITSVAHEAYGRNTSLPQDEATSTPGIEAAYGSNTSSLLDKGVAGSHGSLEGSHGSLEGSHGSLEGSHGSLEGSHGSLEGSERKACVWYVTSEKGGQEFCATLHEALQVSFLCV